MLPLINLIKVYTPLRSAIISGFCHDLAESDEVKTLSICFRMLWLKQWRSWQPVAAYGICAMVKSLFPWPPPHLAMYRERCTGVGWGCVFLGRGLNEALLPPHILLNISSMWL